MGITCTNYIANVILRLKMKDGLRSELEDACKLVCQTFDLDYSQAIVTYNLQKGYFKIENIPDIANLNEKLFNITDVYVRTDKLKAKKEKSSCVINTRVLLVIASIVGTLKIPIGLLTYHNGNWSLKRFIVDC